MNRILSQLALGISLALFALPCDVMAQRGGGYARGGGGGGYHGGQMGGGSMSHSPSFSQPRPQSGQSGSYGNHSQYGNQAGSGSSHNAGSAAAGAGYANRNQSQAHPAGAAAAGAGYANHNESSLNHPGAAGAAAGAGYANRNDSDLNHPGAAGAAAGAGYAYNHSGMGNGYWGGNYSGWGASGMGMGYASGVGAWGAGSPMYGWGYSGYSNPYSYGGGGGAVGVAQGAAVQQPGNAQQSVAAPASDYSQPISTTAPAPSDNQSTALYDQAREAFKTGDYPQALQLVQQALARSPNDATMHEFLALAYFAQGKYPQAAAPLYAVLSVRPGWDWTTLSGMYADIDTYTRQLRALEGYVKENQDSAQGHFVLAYHYLTQGHDPEAIAQLKTVVKLQPADTLSAQIIAQFQPAGGTQPPSAEMATAAAPAAPGKLPGKWAAAPAADTKIALEIQDDGSFTWNAASPGKPPMSIAGKSTYAGDILTLAALKGQSGALVGQVAWKDPDNFTFRLVGAPATDPGLKFAR
jgi:tetratricopeptide (TPR) repeat protein